MKRTERLTTRLIRRACCICVAAGALAIPRGADAQSFSFEKVMLKGEPAPGTEPGTVFGALPTIYLTTVPRLDDDGRVVFTATLEGPAVTAANRMGIWSGDPGAASLIERAGAQADGVAPGTVWQSFPVDIALQSPPIGNGRLGIAASLTGPNVSTSQDEGIWLHESGATQLLAREGDAAADLTPGLVYLGLLQIDVNDAGDAFVSGSVNGTGVTSANDECFWARRGGALEVIVREGDAVPGLPGVTFGGAGQHVGTGYSFESVAWSNTSKLGIQANITGAGIDYGNNEALWVERANGLTLLAREGDEAPGFNGNVTFGGSSVTADFGDIELNALGQAAFIARVGGGSVPFAVPMFSEHTGTLTKLVMGGDPAPGTDQTFGIVTNPMLSDGGRIAFRAALSNGGSWPPLGIWWDQPGAVGELVALAVPGEELTGHPGVTVVGTSFLLAFSADGRLAFEATIEDAVSGQREALLLAHPSGAIDIVVDTAELFDVQGVAGNGSDMRAPSTVDVGDVSESGAMAVRIDFADGSFGFYRVTSAATAVSDAAPGGAIRLEPNAPNPFGDATRIAFELPRPGRAAVSVFDASGRLVRRLIDEPRAAGRHTLVWDGTDRTGSAVASGVYWARLDAEDASRSMRMVLLRQ